MIVKIITNLILFSLSLIPVLIAVAYIILAERKVMASIQRRKGPNVVGLFGLLQPFIDAVKLLTKEQITPLYSNFFLFIFGPIFTLSISLIGWCFIPFNFNNFYYDFTYSVLYLLIFSSFGVYGLVISGWASNSRYALLGALRSISQFISYELVLMFCILPIIAITGSANFIDIVIWQQLSVWFIIPLWPIAFIFFIASLAETNRTPFDLPEAEAELVAGYNVEYSSVFFILFMFAEYNSILIMSALFSLLFLGGWTCPFGLSGEIFFALKITIISFCFILIRATQPRLRFDQLMNFCWKRFLPLSFSLFLFSLALYMFFLNFTIDFVTIDFWFERTTNIFMLLFCLFWFIMGIGIDYKKFQEAFSNGLLVLVIICVMLELIYALKYLLYFISFLIIFGDEVITFLLIETVFDVLIFSIFLVCVIPWLNIYFRLQKGLWQLVSKYF